MPNLKINKLYPIVVVMFLTFGSCSGQQSSNSQSPQHMIKKGIDTTMFDKNHIEANFPLATIEDINIKKVTFNGELNYHIPFSVLSDVFLIPLNEVKYNRSYIQNIYKTFYSCKISDSIWILAYHYHYDQHDYDVIWNLYDSNLKRVTSKIVVSGFNPTSQRELRHFDGSKIIIYTKYNRHFENGMEGDNSKPIEVESIYEIQGNKFVAQ